MSSEQFEANSFEKPTSEKSGKFDFTEFQNVSCNVTKVCK